MSRLVSVDPGKKGAIAVFENGVLQHVYDPDSEGSLTNKFIELLGEGSPSNKFIEILGLNDIVVIEKVNGRPGQSAPAAFNFGKGFGELLGACKALAIEPILIPPNVWKPAMGLSKAGLTTMAEFKRLSVDTAANEFGNKFFYLAKHDGRAEAALLGAYWLRKS